MSIYSEFKTKDLIGEVENSTRTPEEKKTRLKEIEREIEKPNFYQSIILISIVVKFFAFIGGADTYLCIFPAVYGMISYMGEIAYPLSHVICLVAVIIIDLALFKIIDDFKNAMLDGFSIKEDWKSMSMAFIMIAMLGGISISVSVFMRDFTGEIMLNGFRSVIPKDHIEPKDRPQNILAFDMYQTRIKTLELEQKNALAYAGTPYQRGNAEKSLFLKNKIETEREQINRKYGDKISSIMSDFGGVAKLYATKDTAETNARIRKEASKIRLDEIKKDKLAILTMRIAVGSTLFQLLFALWIVGMANFVDKNSYDALKKTLRAKIAKLK